MTGIRFDDRVAIVTGAGAGLGRAYALELARRGAAVVANDLNAGAVDGVVDEIRAAGGIAVGSHDSVATAASGAAIVDLAISEFGRVDALINNAGFLRNGLFEDLSVEAIEALLDVHLKGAIFVTQPAWRAMRNAGYGRVVLTSSSSAAFSHQGLSNYAAAKGGLLGFGRALAYEGAECGIRVNCLLPFARTQIASTNPIPRHAEEAARHYSTREGELVAARNTPAMVTPLALYLCSAECAVTGEAFSACAGRYARVFTAVTPGWLADDASAVSLEDIAEHLDQVRAQDGYSVPGSLYEEVGTVARRLLDVTRTQIAPGGSAP